MTGPGDNTDNTDNTAAAEGQGDGHLRASHADREKVVGTLKVAFVQDRLTKEELDTRVGQAFASRTYADLAEVTADIPAELTGAWSPRDPWRATKIAWGVVYALVLPGLITLVAFPRGPAPAVWEVVTYSAVVYVVFWILGASVMVASRLGRHR
jgi:hypothetical protein